MHHHMPPSKTGWRSLNVVIFPPVLRLVLDKCTVRNRSISYWNGIKSGKVQWPRGLRRRSAVCRLLGLWVRIPPGTWMSVCCECCVLSGRGLCDGLITRPEDPYRLWCVNVIRCNSNPLHLQRVGRKKSVSFIHSAVCLATGPKPLPKRFLHIARSRASSFK